MSAEPLPAGESSGFLAIHRGELVAVAGVGLALGVVALTWPAATLVTVALIFGIYLLASGVFRITAAFVVPLAGAGLRWLSGVLGVLIAAAWVFCLANPTRSLLILAATIGFGWIAQGTIDIVSGVQGVITPLWLALVSGVVAVVAGIVTLTLPGLAVAAFLDVGAVLLILVSVSTLLTLPRRNTIASR